MAYNIPPDDVVPGPGPHVQAHRDIADVLTGMGAALNVLSTAHAGGADPSGGTDSAAAITAALAAAAPGQAVFMPRGVYRTSAPLVVPSGVRLCGEKGASAAGSDSASPSNPAGTIVQPLPSWDAGGLSPAGVLTLAAGSTGTHIRDLWVVGLSTPTGSTGPAGVGGICTTGTGAHAVYLQNVGSVWNTGDGFGLYAGGGWHLKTVYAGNNLGHGLDCSGTTDSTMINVHSQSNGQGGTTGDGFYNLCANVRLVACRADLNQNGFTVNAADGGGYIGCVHLIGCGTQRNNCNGLNVINSNAAGNALRDLVLASGCCFFGDGQNGTNSAAGITGGAGGGGYAGVAVSGRNTVQLNGTNVLVGTVDVAGGCPQYAIATATAGSGNTKPALIQVSGGVLNAVTATLNDAAGMGAAVRISPVTEQNTGQQYDGGTSYPVQSAEVLGAPQDLFTAPAGAVAVTFPRDLANAASGALTSGTLYLSAIGILAGTLCTGLAMMTNNAVKTGGTHGWYVLLDKNFKVRAVTADQTDTATVWGVANTDYPLAFTAAYRAAYSGLFYAGVMVAETGGTTPTFDARANNLASNVTGLPPVLCGTSSTGLTGLPSLGDTMATIGASAAHRLYAYIT